MQSKALAMEERTQLAICHACMDRYGVRLRVQRNQFVHRLQGQEIVGAICYVVEAMARSQHL